MAGEGWTRMPLDKFVALQRGHDLPDERRQPGKVPILGSFGITGWHGTAKARGPGVTVGRSGASFGVVTHSIGHGIWMLRAKPYENQTIDLWEFDPTGTSEQPGVSMTLRYCRKCRLRHEYQTRGSSRVSGHRIHNRLVDARHDSPQRMTLSTGRRGLVPAVRTG